MFAKKENMMALERVFFMFSIFFISKRIDLQTEQRKIIVFIILLNKLRASRCHNHVLIQFKSFFMRYEVDENWPKIYDFFGYVVCQLFQSFFLWTIEKRCLYESRMLMSCFVVRRYYRFMVELISSALTWEINKFFKCHHLFLWVSFSLVYMRISKFRPTTILSFNSFILTLIRILFRKLALIFARTNIFMTKICRK